MSKDPAFLFYSQDWVVGCQTLTMAERGQYITLICMMHQQGRLDAETIRLLVGSVSVRLMSKFSQDEQGFYYSERLEKEVFQRKKFVESRRKNGAKGGKPKDYKVKKTPKPLGKPIGKHMGSLMEDVNEIEIEYEIKEKGSGEKPEVVINTTPFPISFLNHWDRWLEYKKQELGESYKAIKTQQTAFNQLVKYSGGSEERAIEIIDTAISNQWRGIWPLNNKSNANTSTTGNNTGKAPRTGGVANSKIEELLNCEILTKPRGNPSG